MSLAVSVSAHESCRRRGCFHHSCKLCQCNIFWNVLVVYIYYFWVNVFWLVCHVFQLIYTGKLYHKPDIISIHLQNVWRMTGLHIPTLCVGLLPLVRFKLRCRLFSSTIVSHLRFKSGFVQIKNKPRHRRV